MPYEFLEDIATADIAFVAWGKKLEQAFMAAADATVNVMVEELSSIRPKVRREVSLRESSLDMLLFDFLQELIYYKDSEALLLRVYQLHIHQEEGDYLLEAVMQGEKLDPRRHPLRVDVKAVTLHEFRLEKTDRGWETQVILDI